MVLDYLSQNETLAYPFKDKCSRKAANNYMLPNAVFADAFVVTTDSSIIGVYVKSITYTSNNITVKFAAFSDYSYTIVSELDCVIADNGIENHKTYSASNSYFKVKIVAGSAFEELLTSGNLVFQPADSLFAAGAVITASPKVKSVSFYNYDDSLVASFSGSDTVEVLLNLEEGSNIKFTNENSEAVIDVSPGLGTGLYNGCGDDLVIKSINEIVPDTYGNFLMQTDGCYNIDKQDAGLTITNVCTPKCTSSQLNAFAHYLNRIRDALISISEYAATIQEELADAITTFNEDLTRTTPSIRAAVTKFDNPYGNPYYSFVVSFFNKTNEEIEVSTTITGASVLQQDSIRFKQGSRTVTTYTTVDITELVPCHEQGRLEFVISNTTGASVTIEATAGDTTFSKTFTLP